MDVFWGIFLITHAKSLREGRSLNICFLSQFSRRYDTICTCIRCQLFVLIVTAATLFHYNISYFN